ncbi:unnamed protein product [Lota lota]
MAPRQRCPTPAVKRGVVLRASKANFWAAGCSAEYSTGLQTKDTSYSTTVAAVVQNKPFDNDMRRTDDQRRDNRGGRMTQNINMAAPHMNIFKPTNVIELRKGKNKSQSCQCEKCSGSQNRAPPVCVALRRRQSRHAVFSEVLIGKSY